ncbi:kinetochore component CENP-S-domain-containing protein [Gaertneriomyces semiglobifer]|nr:kinetochore component CENP-S-domain-containing protein [Gaertneriomyces semiglobifer]
MAGEASGHGELGMKKRLEAAVHYTVAKICEEEGATDDVKASPHFLHALSLIVMSHAETMATDMEAFAKHAKRSTISVDDVKLCARRNESLSSTLHEFAEQRGLGKKRGTAK